MKNIFEYISDAEKEYCGKLFCVDTESKYTYGEAISTIKSIACFFSEKNIKRQPVILKADRNNKTLLAILGIVLSGNFYVPVNPEYAEGKIKSIVGSSEIKYEVSFGTKIEGLTSFDYDEMALFPIDNDALIALYEGFDENNEIYTIYTSGSTGDPKGVVKTHKNVMNFIENFVSTFNFEKGLKIANQAPLFFDASMKDVYLALATGSTLYFPDKSLFAMPMKLVGYLNENEINYICWVPSALTIIVRLNTFRYAKPEHLKYVFFVGEVFMPKYLNVWIEELPNVVFANLYGSTEIAGICLYKLIDRRLDEESPIPLGKPLKNNEVFLDDGEIMIASEQIALRYVNDEVKNKEVFTEKDGKRILRTGDFGYINDEGDVVFSSRKDFQVKHMGYRIELQEIELSVCVLPYVSACAVLFDKVRDKIVAFISVNVEPEPSLKVIISDLKAKLPSYMVPEKIKILTDLPLNSNGKIDRNKLKLLMENL